MSLDLKELERKLDNALAKETPESLTEWLNSQRMNTNIKLNYMQLIEQSDEGKRAMYMKMKKSEIVEMLIECNRTLDLTREPSV